ITPCPLHRLTADMTKLIVSMMVRLILKTLEPFDLHMIGGVKNHLTINFILKHPKLWSEGRAN
ncbi:MAG: hypothetical protein ACRDE2_14725, partial [Chitinophagaceae bacterium]